MMRKHEELKVNGIHCYLLEDAIPKNGKYITVAEDVHRKKYFVKFTNYKNETIRQCLERESRFRMVHPYLERIYGSFTCHTIDGEKVYGVLGNYVEGETLDSYLKTHPNLKLSTILRYAVQLLKAVQYYTEFIKNNRYSHKDLKPKNIMITPEERAVIIDFDCASVPEELGMVCGGTVGYSDPRVFREVGSDVLMDIYSLGRLFCFLIKGEDYFTLEEKKQYPNLKPEVLYGLDVSRLPKKYQKEEYDILRKIFGKMVAEPEKRYRRISNVLQDLERWVLMICPQDVNYIFKDTVFLEAEKTEETDCVMLTYFVQNGKGEQEKTVQLHPYEMYDIVIGKERVMKVYHFEKDLRFIPMKPMKHNKRNYLLQSGDAFNYEETKIQIRRIGDETVFQK